MDAQQFKDKTTYSIENVSKSDLVDIQTVKIDSALTDSERMFRYLEQIRNPYCFVYFSFSVIFSFLAIFEVLQCAFLIFHVFQ